MAPCTGQIYLQTFSLAFWVVLPVPSEYSAVIGQEKNFPGTWNVSGCATPRSSPAKALFLPPRDLKTPKSQSLISEDLTGSPPEKVTQT